MPIDVAQLQAAPAVLQAADGGQWPWRHKCTKLPDASARMLDPGPMLFSLLFVPAQRNDFWPARAHRLEPALQWHHSCLRRLWVRI